MGIFNKIIKKGGAMDYILKKVEYNEKYPSGELITYFKEMTFMLIPTWVFSKSNAHKFASESSCKGFIEKNQLKDTDSKKYIIEKGE